MTKSIDQQKKYWENNGGMSFIFMEMKGIVCQQGNNKRQFKLIT